MKFKMKFIYKVMIVLAVFIASLIFFSSGIKEMFFSGSANIVQMSAATLPTVTMEVGGNEVNLLHGYVSNLDEMIMRETITPLGADRTFTVLITENESVVKKLKYEVLNEDGQEIESDSFTVLDSETGQKSVKIALKETLKSGAEYVVKITLITNESKRIYYYTRIKMYDNGHLTEKLEFVREFHEALIDSDFARTEAVEKYLEPAKNSDNSTYAYVDIHSSLEMVSWGELNPVVIYREVPTVTEFYDSMISVQLNYMVSIETDTNTEYYTVKENFRFNYGSVRTYLYNYERYTEAVFDVANTSLTKSEFKLGITSDTDAETGLSDNGKYIAFIYGRELMLYRSELNQLITVFSFRGDEAGRARELHDQHAVKLLKVHDNGNVDFMVYGYMNRGEYEGRVGIVLYRYHDAELRIEEQLYMPINSSYQLLAADMTDFVYLSNADIFYFSIYDCIYSFNLMTKELSLLAADVPEENLIFCEEEHYLAWQDCSDITKAAKINILNLETSDLHAVEAGPDECVRLYGRINNNIIYGVAHKSDIYRAGDGSCMLPAYRLCIEDGSGNILKEYRKEGYYVSGIEIGDNILFINRVTKTAGAGTEYNEAEPDSILNRLEVTEKPVAVTRRITDRMLTEYYVSLPGGIEITSVPFSLPTANTVLNYDTTVRVSEPEGRTLLHYAYSFGEVIFASDDAAETIKVADNAVGTVINKDGRLIWERGVKARRTEISGIDIVRAGAVYTSVQACMRMLLEYRNFDIETASFDSSRTTVYDWLYLNTKSSPVNLTGATLDEVLYYVYKLRPVIALRPDRTACLIVAYDTTGITVIDAEKGKQIKYDTDDAVEMFEKAGNIFISYVN